MDVCLSFARPEVVSGPRALALWLAANVETLGAPDDGVVLRLGELRALHQAIVSVFEAAGAGRPLPADAVERLNDASALVPFAPRLEPWAGPGGRLVEEPPRRGRSVDVMAAVARSAIRLLGSPEVARLRRCPACARFFLASRPDRVWCSPRCGNRARVARHHERRRPA